MKKSTHRRIETFLLVTFPMALFVGCAGNAGVKPMAANDIKAEQNSVVAVAEKNVAETKPRHEVELFIDIPKKDIEAAQLALDNPFVVNNETMDKGPVIATMNTPINETNSPINAKLEQEALHVSWLDEPVLTTQSVSDEGNIATDTDNTMAVKFSPLKQPRLDIINFASGETDIDMSYLMTLQQHAQFLSQHPGLILTVSGHSDSIGSEQTNQRLSEERALNVYNILLSYGAPEAQLVFDSFGETSPLNDIDNHQENRRVELEYSDEMLLSSR